MKSIFPALLMVTFACVFGYGTASEESWEALDDNFAKLDYVIDLVNEIEIKLTCVEDMVMRLNTLEVLVYLSQKDVMDGLDHVDDWSKNKELAKQLTDISKYQ